MPRSSNKIPVIVEFTHKQYQTILKYAVNRSVTKSSFIRYAVKVMGLLMEGDKYMIYKKDPVDGQYKEQRVFYGWDGEEEENASND